MRKMIFCCHFYILLVFFLQLVLGADLKETPTLGSTKTPRLLSKGLINGEYEYVLHQNHSVFLYLEDTDELYVGGTDFVLKLDANNYHILEQYPLETAGQQLCHEGRCKNVITVIEKFQDSVFVCGTNGLKPKCWKLFPSVSNQSNEIVESYEGTGISPFVHTQNSLSLTVDGDLYAAAPLDVDGSSLLFRRKAGGRTNVWMYDHWVSEPTFISANWVKRVEDPVNEKIYIFFREKNSDPSPEADPWISRVARVCKVDEGGSKRFFQNMWTSFLKARLVCGFPDESLYFNRLQDIFVMHADDWHDTRIYALFSSSWNSTAVCIYSIGMIEKIFENSTFRGYDKEMPTPRPGSGSLCLSPAVTDPFPLSPLQHGSTWFQGFSISKDSWNQFLFQNQPRCGSKCTMQCVQNSKSLPRATVNVVKDHPEMTDWVHSLHYKAPFYISNNNYTKIAVDRVQAADQQVYNVLLLATDSGKIHKILEAGSEHFIISETQLSTNSTIQAMKLDSKKKTLVVGFAEKISTVDLQKCDVYANTCAECVLARDPYCAWTSFGCNHNVTGGIQNIMTGETSVCSEAEEAKTGNRSKRQTDSQMDSRTVHSVPISVPFYLSCPIDSYHAVYTWEHEGRSSPCQQMHSDCLHLIPSMAWDHYGDYDCVSREKDFTKVVKKYMLIEQKIPDEKKDSEWRLNNLLTNASGPAQQSLWILLQNIVMWGIFR